jgi:hypothetical protein
MTANAAFAAALTTFLIVAWMAGELAFLAPFKASCSIDTDGRSAARFCCCS